MLASARGHRPPTVGSRAATQHSAGVSEPVRILTSLEPIGGRTPRFGFRCVRSSFRCAKSRRVVLEGAADARCPV